MSSIDFTVTATRAEAKIRNVSDGALPAVRQALFEGMQLAFRQSQREVPVRPRGRGPSGTLKNSGQLKQPEQVGPTRVRVAITYGGAAKAYASIQHDNRTFHHTIGKAGYVIDPVRDAVPDLQRRMKAALRRLGHEAS